MPATAAIRKKPVHGQSVSDARLGREDTGKLLAELAEAAAKRQSPLAT